jgi:hypothetical protein
MQHYGKLKDEKAVGELTQEVALEKLDTTLADVKVQYKEAEKALKKFYAEEGDGEEEAAADTTAETADGGATAAAAGDDKKEEVKEDAKKSDAK